MKPFNIFNMDRKKKRVYLSLAALVVLALVAGLFLDRYLSEPEKKFLTIPEEANIGDSSEVKLGNDSGDKSNLIRINNLVSGQAIQSPLVIEGEARGNWFFEASFPIKLYDGNGRLIGIAVAQAQKDWMTTDFVPFKAELKFEAATNAAGVLVFEKDNPSGLSEYSDQLSLPITFFTTSEKTNIKIFFNNDKLDPEVTCNQVFPVDREVARTPAIARAALEELLGGLTPVEKATGFSTSINPGVKINSLTIENGVALVDFNEQLQAQVGGSCRVAAIRAQITETLKQFSSIEKVEISIDGRSADILQP